MPDVTVVIPTHNRCSLLPLTLHSVLWQRDVDLEVIIVDDGSTDDTVTVVGHVRDSRVRLIRNDRPRGVSIARNRGLAESTGKWVAFIDDDDLWAPDKLSLQLQAASETGRKWAYAGQVNVTVDLRVIGGRPPLPPEQLVKRLPRANAVPGGGSGVLARKYVLVEEKGFDAHYKHFADWDLWLRLARRHGLPACVSKPLVGYRIHRGARSMDTEGMVAELDDIEARHGVKVDRVAFYRHVVNLALLGRKRRDALRYLLRAAILLDSTYLRKGFLGDLRLVAVTTLGHFAAGRLELLRSVRDQLRRRGDHPHQDWWEEGRKWVRELDLH